MEDWDFEAAPWWKFWSPGSGLIGGIIMTSIVLAVLCLFTF